MQNPIKINIGSILAIPLVITYVRYALGAVQLWEETKEEESKKKYNKKKNYLVYYRKKFFYLRVST